MRVLFVSRCLPLPAWHGDRLIARHVVTGLRARGHRVAVAALLHPGDEAHEEASRQLCDRLEVAPDRARTARDFAARVWRPFPGRAGLSSRPRLFDLVTRLAREEAPDVVHFFGGIQVSEFRDAARGYHLLITPYESQTLFLERAAADAETWRERAAARVRSVGAAAIERRIYRGFGAVVVLTDVDARRLAALDPTLPLRVIPNGVDVPEVVTPVGSRRAPLIVFSGNFSYEPNVVAARRLAHAILPLVRARVPAARLVLAGATPSPEVTALGGPGVDVTGTIDDIRPWLQQARVCVSPLTRGAGMKNKVLEALAAGAPLVATPQSCDGLNVEHGVHALLADRPDDIANAVLRVLWDEGLSTGLAARGRELVTTRFTWDTVVTRYERLYAELEAA